MHDDHSRSLTVTDATDPDQARRAVDEARRHFQRVLSAWACDLLILRREGRDTPCWRGEHDAGLREAA